MCIRDSIRILEKGTKKLGELDGVEYYIASPVTFAVRGRVYYTCLLYTSRCV